MLKKWYEVFAANDCLEDHVTWNDMIDYIKHSACLDFTIHSTCTSTGEAFKFTANSIAIEGDRAIYINDDNTFVGHGAGDNIGAGTNNTLMGHDTGQANNFSSCAFFGYEAGKNNIQNEVTGVGYQTLRDNTGTYNTAIGHAALSAACTGGYNTAIGKSALKANLGGMYNIGIGSSAGLVNTTGHSNVFIGYKAGDHVTIGHENVFIGRQADYSAVDADGCVCIGYLAGGLNNTDNRFYINNSSSAFPLIYGEFDNDKVKFGDNNAAWLFEFEANAISIAGDRAIYIKNDETYIGHGAGDNITPGSGINNTLIGNNAANTLTTGDNNTVVGYWAGKTLAATAERCVFIGAYAGENNTESQTIAIGYEALEENDGFGNLAIGSRALTNNTTGEHNIAIGFQTGKAVTDGYNNSFFGYAAGMYINHGDDNTFGGYNAGYDIVSGCSNTILGSKAGENCAVGVGNSILIGYEAGQNNAVSNRLYINNSNSAFPLIYGEFDNDIVKFGDNSAAWNIQFMQSRIHMLETTTPGAIVNYGALYFKADNKLYAQTGDGVEHEVAFV